MIELDTKILVRLIAQDDPVQFEKAKSAIASAASVERPALVNVVVLTEVVWVLSRAYRYPRLEIIEAIEKLLEIKELELQNSGEVFEALQSYRESPADFSNLLLAELNHASGCEKTLTSDRKAGEKARFRLLN